MFNSTYFSFAPQKGQALNSGITSLPQEGQTFGPVDGIRAGSFAFDQSRQRLYSFYPKSCKTVAYFEI
jgi:hypothetical protein